MGLADFKIVKLHQNTKDPFLIIQASKIKLEQETLKLMTQRTGSRPELGSGILTNDIVGEI